MAETGDSMAHPLSATERPDFETAQNPLAVVDLFAGCGGLTLGVAQAAHALGRGLDVRLAVESSSTPAAVYKTNFPGSREVRVDDVTSIFALDLAEPVGKGELKLAKEVGKVNILVGGPPCQGHSNLNNHTRREDPKNALYAIMARAARVLAPDVVVIENVPAVLNDRYEGKNAVQVVSEHLRFLDYEVDHRVLSLRGFGVAQTRKRHVLLATRRGFRAPSEIFEALDSGLANADPFDLRWAIGDLVASVDGFYDRAPKASPANDKRMGYLLENGVYDLPNALRPPCHQGDHSYKSMYGRLRWEYPAQTITSGFGSIGQGRYMHPDFPRALTPHEAARIQGFPDYFEFGAVTTRGALARMIGNAVPPQLARALVLQCFETGTQS